ncbi:MAG: hypothetical protein EOP11_18485 [Proteobacteria bacterium]|nr:MAG: hypothetical protein EOP11_18485 [Pseudomonadota bacterium]
MGALQLNSVKRFRMHSVSVEIRGAAPSGLLEDFDFYTDRPTLHETEEQFAVVLELVSREPQAGDLPAASASRSFAEGVLYRHGTTLTYEFGNAVLIVEQHPRSTFGRLITTDPVVAAKVGQQFLQGEIARGLDLAGLHRINGLGIGLPGGRGALILLPPGMEKGALALRLLEGGATLLSELSPLVDRFGRLAPFPLPLHFSSRQSVPTAWREHLVSERAGALSLPIAKLPSAYLPRLGDRYRPSFVVVGAKGGSRAEASFARLPRWRTGARLMKDLVAGFGLPGVESGLPDLASLAGLAPRSASRLTATSALLARAEGLSMNLSHDLKENARALLGRFGI